MISIIVYDASYRERFFQINSLEKQTLDNDLFEYIWVENFSQPNKDLKRKLKKTSLNYKLLSLKRKSCYHLGKCVNYGVKEAQGDIIVIADADTYFEPEVLEKTLRYHNENSNSVLYIHRYDEPQPPMLREQDEIILSKLRSRCKLLNEFNYGGFMSVSKENYIESGGYEEHPVFAGDSAGAMDLRVRFENMGLDCHWANNLKIYHIYHEHARGGDRWNGFRVESQWRMANYRKKKNVVKPLIGYEGRYRELGEWWESWLEKWDQKSINYGSPIG